MRRSFVSDRNDVAHNPLNVSHGREPPEVRGVLCVLCVYVYTLTGAALKHDSCSSWSRHGQTSHTHAHIHAHTRAYTHTLASIPEVRVAYVCTLTGGYHELPSSMKVARHGQT